MFVERRLHKKYDNKQIDETHCRMHLGIQSIGKADSLALGFSCPIQHTLKGIPFQSEVGFLSLFEHYRSCTVSTRRAVCSACYVSLFIESTTKSAQDVISYQSMTW